MDFGREIFVKMLLICFSECVGKLVTRPQNTAALEGSEVFMSCSTNNHSTKLLWRHLNIASPGNLVTIYTGNRIAYSYNSIYGITTEKKGEFGLKFRASSSLSLYYLCEEPGVEGSGADLIVLQSTKCEHIKDSGKGSDSRRYSNITVKCTIRFKGCWTPELNWTLETAEAANHQLQNSLHVTNESSDGFLISTATVAAHQSLNNTQLKCKLKFTTRRKSLTRCTAPNITSYKTAENVPEYSFDWKSPPFAVSKDSDSNWYFEIREDAYDEAGNGVSLSTVIVIVIVIGFVLIGNVLICRALAKTQKTHLVPYFVSVSRKERSSVARRSGVENNATGTERVEETGTETVEANSREVPGLIESSDVHGREQNPQKATNSKSNARPNYVEMRGQITELKKSGNLKTDKNAISTTESQSSGNYMTMNPRTVRPSDPPPPTPPQTNQTPGSNDAVVVAGRSSYTGTGPPKPPRASVSQEAERSSSVEYAQLEFPSLKATAAAKPVRRTYENTMFSCVDVYASIDHNAKAPDPPPSSSSSPPSSLPPPPPSSLPPPPSSLPPPPPSSLPPPSNRPVVDTIDESDEDTKTIIL